MRTLLRTALICLLASTAVAVAQENPLSGFTKSAYGKLKDTLLRTAEKVPEENYGFKPTEAVRERTTVPAGSRRAAEFAIPRGLIFSLVSPRYSRTPSRSCQTSPSRQALDSCVTSA